MIAGPYQLIAEQHPCQSVGAERCDVMGTIYRAYFDRVSKTRWIGSVGEEIFAVAAESARLKFDVS